MRRGRPPEDLSLRLPVLLGGYWLTLLAGGLAFAVIFLSFGQPPGPSAAGAAGGGAGVAEVLETSQ